MAAHVPTRRTLDKYPYHTALFLFCVLLLSFVNLILWTKFCKKGEVGVVIKGVLMTVLWVIPLLFNPCNSDSKHTTMSPYCVDNSPSHTYFIFLRHLSRTRPVLSYFILFLTFVEQKRLQPYCCKNVSFFSPWEIRTSNIGSEK